MSLKNVHHLLFLNIYIKNEVDTFRRVALDVDEGLSVAVSFSIIPYCGGGETLVYEKTPHHLSVRELNL